MTAPRFPRAKTNPLSDDVEDATLSGRGAIDLDDDSHDVDLQKGMPARNLRNIGIGVMAVGLVAFLLWPSKPYVKPVEVPNPQPTDLVKGLVDDLQRPQQPVTLPEFKEEKPATPVQLPEPAVDERIQLALLSPMAATDVDLGTSIQKLKEGADPTSPVVRGQEAQLDARKQALERQNQLGGVSPLGSTTPATTAGDVLASLGAGGSGSVQGEARAQHLQFIAENRGDGGIGEAAKLQPARRSPTLYEGTLIRTVLTRSLNSDLPGSITAKVTSDLYDSVTQEVLLVPRGSEVICNYDSNLLVGQEVILAACTRLRLPNGRSFSLNGTPAGSEAGASGLPAEVNNHFLKMFGSALVVGAVSYLMPSSDRRVTITTGADGSRESGGTIFGSALAQVVQSTIARNVRIPPTGTVEIGTPFTLTLTRDVEMEPYLPGQRRGAQ